MAPLDSKYFETFQGTKEKLEEVERTLARRLGFMPGDFVRRRLIALDRAHQLPEDDDVSRWYELHTSYRDWVEWEEHAEDTPRPTNATGDQGAAQAAFCIFENGFPWLLNHSRLSFSNSSTLGWNHA